MVHTSTMEMHGDVIVHASRDGAYLVLINPDKWLLAVARTMGVMLEGGLNAEDETDVTRAAAEGFARMDEWELSTAHMRTLAAHRAFFTEAHVLRLCAIQHRVPPDAFRFILSEHPADILELVSQHTRIEEVPMDSVSALATHVMTYDLWPRESYADYVDWVGRINEAEAAIL